MQLLQSDGRILISFMFNNFRNVNTGTSCSVRFFSFKVGFITTQFSFLTNIKLWQEPPTVDNYVFSHEQEIIILKII